MPGSIPPTSQLDWLISTTAMIVLFWSRATRDLLKSFGWGIAALHRLMQRRSCHPRRPPHSISPLEGDGFEPSVPPVGNYAHETALFDRHGHFPSLLDRRRTRSGIVHTAKCLIAEGRLLGDNELRQIQELGSAVV